MTISAEMARRPTAMSQNAEPIVAICEGGAYTERQLAAAMQLNAYREGHRPTHFPLRNGGVAIAGITPAEKLVLSVLDGEMTSRQVAIEIGGTNPGAFNLLKKLVEKGVVKSRMDGRSRFWSKADGAGARVHTHEAQA